MAHFQSPNSWRRIELVFCEHRPKGRALTLGVSPIAHGPTGDLWEYFSLHPAFEKPTRLDSKVPANPFLLATSVSWGHSAPVGTALTEHIPKET